MADVGVPRPLRRGGAGADAHRRRTGTRARADAIYQNLNLITDEEPEHVFVFGADHVYRMDVRQMLDVPRRPSKADCTVAAIPVPIEEGARVRHHRRRRRTGGCVSFLEKPKNPPPMPGNPKMCLASMGNYLFTHRRAGAGAGARRRATRPARTTSASRIIPRDVQARAGLRVRLREERDPGPGGEASAATGATSGPSTPTTSRNMDLVEVDPMFNLYNDRWPIHTQPAQLPAGEVRLRRPGEQAASGTRPTRWSPRAASSPAATSTARCSRPKVRVNSFSEVEESILFENVQIGRHCKIRRAIIDKNVEIPPGTTIGYDLEADRQRFTSPRAASSSSPRA